MKISLSAAFSKPIEYQGTDAKNRFSSQSEKTQLKQILCASSIRILTLMVFVNNNPKGKLIIVGFHSRRKSTWGCP